jgi:hypothetical protein
MTADEWLKLQPLAPQRLGIKDLHLEQIHDSVGVAADALEGYVRMNKHWDLHGTLTSLRFTFCQHFDKFTVSTTHHAGCCCRCWQLL